MLLKLPLRLIAGAVLLLLLRGSLNIGPAQQAAAQVDPDPNPTSDDSLAVVNLPVVLGQGSALPAAVDDAYQTPEDTALVVSRAEGVLANDTDPQQQALRAVLVSDVAHGVLALNEDGSFGYTPTKDFNGQDSFMYRAVTASTESQVATVTISVAPVNDPPYYVNGERYFTTRIIGTKVKQAHAVVAADLDRDGDIDVAATDYQNGEVRWFENDGAGKFISHVLDADLAGAYPAHVGDVDGDGHADVMAAGYLANTFAWYRNDGGGNFTRFDIDTATDGPHSIVSIDLDQDGDIDFVTSSQDANTIDWYENDGAENFTHHRVDDTALGAKRAEVADLDGDGDLDIVTASNFSDEIAWHENNGNQEFTKRVIDAAADGAYFVNPADADGDGDMDVFSASALDSTIALYRNDGTGNFTFEVMDTEAVGARSVISADLDRDGDMDAVTASREDDTVAWFINDGTGTFTQQIIDDAANGAYGVFDIDIDFDGNMDVLSASRMSAKIALHTHVLGFETSVKQGGTVAIDSTALLAKDVDNVPSELIFTITGGPNVGEVRLNGVALATGGTFSQADINEGRVTYIHDGKDDAPVSFTFLLSDGGAQEMSPQTGTLTIEMIGSLSR